MTIGRRVRVCPRDHISSLCQIHRFSPGLMLIVVSLSSYIGLLSRRSILGILFVGHVWRYVFFIVAMACRLSQSSVGVPMQSVVISLLCPMGGSSIEYALASTVSPKRRCGVIIFLILRQFWQLSVGRECPPFFLVGNDP